MSHDPHDTTDRREGHLTADQATIRDWTDEHDVIPVRRTDRPEEINLLPEDRVETTHDRIEWDEFFDVFDERDYVVRYYGASASEPFDIRQREEVFEAIGADSEEMREQLLAGETVESVITETTTVESVIIEEATVESELVGSDVVDQHILDVELVNSDCVSCSLVDEEMAEHEGWFDADRYLDSIRNAEGMGTGGVVAGEPDASASVRDDEPDAETSGRSDVDPEGAELGAEVPYRAELEVEERWVITRELLEQFTVESRIEDTDITETDTIEDHDIDVRGLQQTIAEMGLLEGDLSPDEVMSHYEIETEIAGDDRIHTYFNRERVVEDEVVGRRRLDTEITGGELGEFDVVHTEDLVTETMAGEETGEPGTGVSGPEAGAGEPGTGADDLEAGAQHGSEGAPGGAGEPTGSPAISADDVGKTVLDANSEEVGMVTSVDEDENVLYADAHPGITERIKAALDWGSPDEGDAPILPTQIEEITDDEVRLKGSEELQSDEELRDSEKPR